MTTKEWLEGNPGLWWCSHSAALKLLRVVGAGANRHVCVVPHGAPLMERLSPIANCRLYCQLGGTNPTAPDIVTAVRTVELPDYLAMHSASHLEGRYRTQTWLAIARLSRASILVLVDPLSTVSPSQSVEFARVLRESAAYHRHIVIAADREAAVSSLGALRMPIMSDLDP